MGILADFQIEKEIVITPFAMEKVPGEISSGISSFGYDCRLGTDFKIFTPTNCAVIDPKNFDPGSFVSVKSKPKPDNYITIPPNSFALGVSLERFKIPRDVLVVCLGKSTLARCGLIINVTPLEPEWEGHVTIEISNTAPLPCRVYAEEGIMQLLFFRSDVHREHSDNATRELMQSLEGIVSSQDHWADKDHGCRTSYADKKGRYQSQKAEVTLPFVRQEVKNELEADVAYNLVRGGLPPRQPKVTKEPKAHKFNHKKKKSK